MLGRELLGIVEGPDMQRDRAPIGVICEREWRAASLAEAAFGERR